MKIETIEDIKNFFSHAHMDGYITTCYIKSKLLEEWFLNHHILLVNNREAHLRYEMITKRVYRLWINGH